MVLSLTLLSAIFLTFITTVFSQGNSTANVNNNNSSLTSSTNNSTLSSNGTLSSGNATNTAPK